MATTTSSEVKRVSDGFITTYEQSIPATETGDAILLESQRVTVSAHPGAASGGKVQYSTSPPSRVLAGTARWIDWARAEVTAAASDIPEGPITAVRGVHTSGANPLILEVVFGGRA